MALLISHSLQWIFFQIGKNRITKKRGKEWNTIANRLVRELGCILKVKKMFEEFKKIIELFKSVLADRLMQ